MSTGSLPRVVIDGRMVGAVTGGVARYVRMIAKGLADISKLRYEPIFLCAPGMSSSFSGFETVEQRTAYLDPKEIATIPIQLWKSRAKLYHSPSFSSLVSAPCPWIVTIHDLYHLAYGSQLERVYYEGLLKTFALRAKAVLTVSDFSKKEIEAWMPKVRAEVVYNAIDPQFLKEGGDIATVLDRFGVKKNRYFLCLSNAKPHKNISTLVRAFASFRASSEAAKEFRLVLSLNRFAGEPGIVSSQGIHDSDAHALLRGCRALVFPSVYEGFGLPPVEGAVLGAPLIVSDIPAHREALRDLGPNDLRWVPPLDEAAWMNAFRFAAEGSSLRSISESSRKKLIERYSVKRLGEKMNEIYETALGLQR